MDGKTPVFLAECNAVESTMLADVLKQAGIPCLTKGVLGAGFIMEAAPLMERYRFYVPGDRISEARNCYTSLFPFSDDDHVKILDMPE